MKRHGAAENRGPGTRWALIATYCRWWVKQMFDIPGTLPPAFFADLTPPQKAVLGYCSIPHRTEADGVDMKRGYADLPAVR